MIQPRHPGEPGAPSAGAGNEPPPDQLAAGAGNEPPPDQLATGAGSEPPPASPAAAAAGKRPGFRRRLGAAFSMIGLAILAFAVGLVVFNSLVMPRFIHGEAEVRVPDLTNLTFDQAEKLVSPLRLQVSRAGERFDPSAPSGFILSQDPPEGTPVRGRHRVMVMISLGEEFSSVPALFGGSQRGARLLIERAGLRVGGTTRAPSDEVGEGLVVASDPAAENVLPRGAPVSLLISTGAGREEYVMPDLLGRDMTSVRRQLEAIGLRIVTPAGAPSTGAIVFQDPPAGTRITRDATLTLQSMGRLIR